MSWLASILLDYELVARKRLNDNYRWHQEAWKAFPAIQRHADTDKSDNSSQKRTVFLSRVIHKKDMVIQWENGEKIQTETDFQGRIQKRRQLEKIAREAKENEGEKKPRKTSKSSG